MCELIDACAGLNVATLYEWIGFHRDDILGMLNRKRANDCGPKWWLACTVKNVRMLGGSGSFTALIFRRDAVVYEVIPTFSPMVPAPPAPPPPWPCACVGMHLWVVGDCTTDCAYRRGRVACCRRKLRSSLRPTSCRCPSAWMCAAIWG
jgi:hypothetical protein